MNKKKGIFAALISIVLVSFLCIFLYQKDNKYTREEIQPINGVLFYSDDVEFSYLTRQWMIYPDVILTPNTVNEYTGYRYYGDIGEKNETLKNSMTYRLTLMLPDESKQYALEVPEIFSSYKLYINDSLTCQLGNPSPEHYEEAIYNQIINFSASGETEILLCVSDFSGLNAGMTYPPAFGDVDALHQIREGRLLLHGAFILFALIGIILSIIFGIRVNLQKSIFTCLICLCMAVITGYPLYHSFFITKVQPWYTLEPTCYYALLLLALLLQTEFYNLKLRNRLLIAAPCILGMVFTCFTFGMANILPESMSHIFSLASMCLKYYTAACLLIISFWAVWHDKCHSILLLCGSAALSTALIFDRLLPLYEPIYGGWFGEIGSVLLVLTLGAVILQDAMDSFQFRLTYEESFQQMEQNLLRQKEHYNQLTEQIKLSRETAHDLHHHMRIMKSMAEQKNWDSLENYLEQYDSHLKERDIITWSDHPAADAILRYFAATAKELNAAYDVRLAIPPDLAFPDAELCILLSNLLENAVEAIGKQEKGNRKIYMRGESVSGHLGIVIDNTFNGIINIKNDVYLSTKHPGHGLGISSVNTIVNKYGGLADFSAENGIFHVSILIPLPSK